MAAESTLRWAWVTGAAGALGAAVCEALSAAGHGICATDQDAAGLERLRGKLPAERSEIRRVDVGDAQAMQAAAAAFAAAARAPTIFVHCAGTPGEFGWLSQMSDAQWRQTMAVHLDGAFFGLRATTAAMRAAGFGRVLLISSLAGVYGAVGSGAYSAAKAGQLGLMRTAAKELGPHGITVNAIAPGLIASPANLALQERGSGFITAGLQECPTRQMSQPADLAALVVFLVSAAAGNINGQVLEHDGGAGVSAAVDEYLRERLNRAGKQEGT